MREEVATFGDGLVGIVTHPDEPIRSADLPGVIVLNPGLVSRVGNYRLNVDLCRTLASQGYLCCRFDLSGVGDSLARDSAETTKDIWIQDTLAAIKHLGDEFKHETVVLVGSCTGARIAAEVAMRSRSVVGVIPINFDAPNRAIASDRRTRFNLRSLRVAGIERFIDRVQQRLGRKKKDSVDQTLSLIHARSGDFFGSKTDDVLSVWKRLLSLNLPVMAVYSEFDGLYSYFDITVRPFVSENALDRTLTVKVIRYGDHNLSHPRAQRDFKDAVSRWLHQHFLRSEVPGHAMAEVP